jgi:hypothetical protein
MANDVYRGWWRMTKHLGTWHSRYHYFNSNHSLCNIVRLEPGANLIFDSAVRDWTEREKTRYLCKTCSRMLTDFYAEVDR